MWWQKLRQEDPEFEASLDKKLRHCFKNKNHLDPPNSMQRTFGCLRVSCLVSLQTIVSSWFAQVMHSPKTFSQSQILTYSLSLLFYTSRFRNTNCFGYISLPVFARSLDGPRLKEALINSKNCKDETRTGSPIQTVCVCKCQLINQFTFVS